MALPVKPLLPKTVTDRPEAEDRPPEKVKSGDLCAIFANLPSFGTNTWSTSGRELSALAANCRETLKNPFPPVLNIFDGSLGVFSFFFFLFSRFKFFFFFSFFFFLFPPKKDSSYLLIMRLPKPVYLQPNRFSFFSVFQRTRRERYGLLVFASFFYLFQKKTKNKSLQKS